MEELRRQEGALWTGKMVRRAPKASAARRSRCGGFSVG
jgi:hypothetical protein